MGPEWNRREIAQGITLHIAAVKGPVQDVLSPNELQQLMNQDQSLQLLDVRTGAEFESVHIPGSVNVPLDALNRVSPEIAEAEAKATLVLGPIRSPANQANQQLAAAGEDGLAMTTVLSKLPCNQTTDSNIDTVVAELAQA